MTTASWVIVRRSTGEILFETFNQRLVALINQDAYEVRPVLEHLQTVNREIREGKHRDPENH